MKKDPRTLSWEDVTLGQIRQLALLAEYGSLQQTIKISKKDLASASRDIDRLEKALGQRFTAQIHRTLSLTDEGKKFLRVMVPWLQVCQRISDKELIGAFPKTCRGSAGGSLVGWLCGSRLDAIRGCLADRCQLDIQPDTNREIVSRVVKGALDFGLVRTDVLTDSRIRKQLQIKELGELMYHVYVPKKWLEASLANDTAALAAARDHGLEEPYERDLLTSHPIATVGPEGQFRHALDEATLQAGLYMNVEFSYRAFTMLLPHMMQVSHITIMPDLRQIDGPEIPGYESFPLRLLDGYTRSVSLIVSADENRTMWLKDVDTLASVLKFKKPVCSSR